MSKLQPSISEKDHIQGNIFASKQLVEYGDFECSSCGEAYPVVKKLQGKLKNTLCFVFRNFPVSAEHPHSLLASFAAEAAGMQKKFWDMHDLIFEHQDALEEEDLLSYAKKLNLNLDKFRQDMESDSIKKKVENDFLSGAESGVNGTPTFFINGDRYDGFYDFDNLYLAIERSSVVKEVDKCAKRISSEKG